MFSLTRGLLMDPNAASRFAFVMGVEGVGSSDTWRMISLNFGTLLRTKCELPLVYHNLSTILFVSFTSLPPLLPPLLPPPSHLSSLSSLPPLLPPPSLSSLSLHYVGQQSDYQLVTEHATANSCLLGYKNVYNLTKSSSMLVLPLVVLPYHKFTSLPLLPLSSLPQLLQ